MPQNPDRQIVYNVNPKQMRIATEFDEEDEFEEVEEMSSTTLLQFIRSHRLVD